MMKNCNCKLLLVAWLAGLLVSACHGEITERIRLNSEGDFVDRDGRKLLFHGFNNVLKGEPYYDAQLLNATRIDYLPKWGFNVLRLGVIWHAAMPEEGKFNETYLGVIKQIVQEMSSRGVYVLLDMHQDGLSKRYGNYDGVPSWLLDKFPRPRPFLRYPWPYKHIPAEDWFEAYLTYECEAAYQHIYSNTSNALTYWGDYWAKLAEMFHQEPAILGYELINEPFAGNIYTNPLRALPGYAGSHNLMPVYDYLVSRIRAIDRETLVFYEPVTWGVFAPETGSWFGTGFSRVPGANVNPEEYKRSVLSYHYYCWVLQTADPRTIFPHWKRILCDQVLMKEVYASSKASAMTTGGGRFLTEFGLCAPDGNNKTINTLECNLVMEMADEEFQSWTYWDSNFFDDQGKPQITQMKSFSRVYPLATSGEPLSMKFNAISGEFQYQFKAIKLSPVDGGLIESGDVPKGFPLLDLFIPEEVHYKPEEYQIAVDPEWVKWDRMPYTASGYRFIGFQDTPANTTMTVNITRRQQNYTLSSFRSENTIN